jgi:AraC-like DNA-binding protein
MSIAPTGEMRLVGIRFVPGGAYPFLSVPANEMRDAAPALDDVAPPFAASLSDKLSEVSFGSEAPILDVALGRHLSIARRVTDRRVLASVQATVESDIPLRVDSLVRLTGLGTRQIERVFRESVGYSPKTLCRLVRFQRVVRALERPRRHAFAGLAADHGYADQAHLAREFREYAGTTLTAYGRELHPMSDRFHTGSLTDER